MGTSVSLFLCGDVMLGRGVDQILPNAGDPQLIEPFVHDARAYVDLAEKASGPIPRPVDFGWPWGEATSVLDAWNPDVRILNLETSVTRSGEFAPGKSVHYRMSPGNVAALTAGRPGVCGLANNHVLDFGRSGLFETLDTLTAAGVTWAGAGRDAAESRRPAIVDDEQGAGRVIVFPVATTSSGVPRGWRARDDRPGVAMTELHHRDAAILARRVAEHTRPGDVRIVSIHWGSNWGYDVPREQVEFAHKLIDGGVDVVHGHSSHHPRPIEIYEGKLILYGCGDFINDYEGITGYDEFRDELRLLYLTRVGRASGEMLELWVVPTRAHRMRLELAGDDDVAWIAATLDEISSRHGVRIGLSELDLPGGSVRALRADPG